MAFVACFVHWSSLTQHPTKFFSRKSLGGETRKIWPTKLLKGKVMFVRAPRCQNFFDFWSSIWTEILQLGHLRGSWRVLYNDSFTKSSHFNFNTNPQNRL